MKNFVKEGRTITVTSPTAAKSGDLILFSSLGGGVAAVDAAVGEQLELAVEGVYDVKKATADTLAAGSVAKADPADGVIKTAGTLKIGWVLVTSGPGQTSVRIKLVPGIAG